MSSFAEAAAVVEPARRASGAVRLSDQGYFWVGVQYTQRDGHTVPDGGQLYVEYQIPEHRTHEHAIVLIHGGGGQSLDWVSTPDGRPGWRTLLLQQGYAVYLVDRPGHGRSPIRADVSASPMPTPSVEALGGLFAGAGNPRHTQWPGTGAHDDPALAQLLASQVAPGDLRLEHELMRRHAPELLAKTGAAVVITSSAGAPAGWQLLDRCPDLVRGVVALEPVGPAGPIAMPWGLAAAPLSFDPPASGQAELAFVETGADAETAPLRLQAEPARRLPNLEHVPIAIVTAGQSSMAAADASTVAFLEQAGCARVTHLRLGDRGVHGNGHLMMLERNTAEVLDAVTAWIDEHVALGRSEAGANSMPPTARGEEAMGDIVTFEAQPMRVVFGRGSMARLPHELDHLGLGRVAVVTTPGQRELPDRIADIIGDRCAGVLADAREHVPVESVDAADGSLRALAADGIVAVGGGSPIGLAKALALRTDLPIVAVPTTYAGSEMTSIWGLTSGGVKRTGRDRRVLPASVVYDPDVTESLPLGVSMRSGLNAIAHAVEAMYAPDASPVISALAESGIRDLTAGLGALGALGEASSEGDARALALRGAWLCGACLGATTMGLHHKLCHVLGGTFDLPHAELHAIVLPHVAAFNLPAAPEAAEALARAMGVDDPIDGLRSLVRSAGVGPGLRDLGVPREALGEVVEAVLASPYSNPRPVTRTDLASLIHDIWEGNQ